MRTSVKVKGLDKLLKKLDKIAALHKQDALKDALAAGAAVAAQDAKRRVPVQSGDLKASIHVGGYTELTPDYRAVGAYGALPGPKGSGQKVGVLVGTKLPYAHLVELGTAHSMAQPFLRPAADGNQDEIRDAVDDKLQEFIDEA